jgi:hypothetical protein
LDGQDGGQPIAEQPLKSDRSLAASEKRDDMRDEEGERSSSKRHDMYFIKKLIFRKFLFGF